MTRDEILAEPAGPRLDQWVCEIVLGQTWQGGNPIPNYVKPWTRWPWPAPVSTEMAAAWLVVEKLRNEWGQFELTAGIQWHCGHKQINPWGVGDNAPEAICKAALLVAIEGRDGG